MGSQTSSLEDNTVKPELLVSELLCEVRDGDYFAKSMRCLESKLPNSFQLSNKEFLNIQNVIPFDEVYKMVEEGYSKLENGYVRCEDGSYYIACLTDLGPNVTGEMFDWWYCNCDNDEKFKWWHPICNHSGEWDPQFYSVMPQERGKGHYIGHTHIVEEVIDGVVYNLQYEFTRPSKYFDKDKFSENNVTACLAARIYLKDPFLGIVAVGHMVHLVRFIDGANELRSRFWIGDISYPETPENLLFARFVNNMVNTKLFKWFKISESQARGLFKKCKEEMLCLKEFLPHLYWSKSPEFRRIDPIPSPVNNNLISMSSKRVKGLAEESTAGSNLILNK